MKLSNYQIIQVFFLITLGILKLYEYLPSGEGEKEILETRTRCQDQGRNQEQVLIFDPLLFVAFLYGRNGRAIGY